MRLEACAGNRLQLSNHLTIDLISQEPQPKCLRYGCPIRKVSLRRPLIVVLHTNLVILEIGVAFCSGGWYEAGVGLEAISDSDSASQDVSSSWAGS